MDLRRSITSPHRHVSSLLVNTHYIRIHPRYHVAFTRVYTGAGGEIITPDSPNYHSLRRRLYGV